jgi:hypothetical protein
VLRGRRRGECWLLVEGVEQPVRLRAGDCLLLPVAHLSSQATSPSRPWTHAHLFPGWKGTTASSRSVRETISFSLEAISHSRAMPASCWMCYRPTVMLRKPIASSPS